ncbi:MAG TPA: apolipoprotein N-acyltransferase [Thermoanaerobaculia bacterium]|nr:apolipoprotein N-acyltransferase [Thermoanaerobaculia bacterium]
MNRAGWRTPAAGVVSGILFALAFPPFGWVVLLPLALVPWLVALAREESRWRALLSGLLFGLTTWCLSISWITYVVTHFGGQGRAMGVVCLVLLAAILAEWPAAVAFTAVACAPAGSPRRLAVFPVLWMASEHLRSFVYGGFPWNLTGNALYQRPVWLQTASVGGVYLVGGLLVAVSCLLAAAVAFRRAKPLVAAAILVLAAGAFGAARLARRPSDGAAPTLSVALLQPNVSQESRLGGSAGEVYERVIGMARDAAAEEPNLLVIPESAFPIYWDRSPRLRQDLSGVAGAASGFVIFNDVEELPDGRYFNVARLLGPSGLVGPPYRKVHRVPFGEYVPLPRLFFFVRQVSTEIGEFSAAAAPTTLEMPGARIGIGVCYEILYAGLVREEASRLGANLLVTISNDSWYGRAGAQEQHFAGAVLRAVETQRYLLRAAITGISGIVDEKGRIVGELPRDTSGILRGTARLESARTFWTRWGYWLPRLADVFAGAVLLFGVAGLAHGRRRRSS